MEGHLYICPPLDKIIFENNYDMVAYEDMQLIIEPNYDILSIEEVNKIVN